MTKTLIFILVIFVSCNFPQSDYVEELPNSYIYSHEGGNQNRIVRENKFVIDSGIVSVSFNDKYIFFSEDTSYSMVPKKVSKKKLRYYICNIKSDTLSQALKYEFFKKFIKKNKIEKELDISNDDL